MKAIVQHKYGGVDTLKLQEVAQPAVKDNQLLVQVHAANVASGDIKINALLVPPVLQLIMRLIFGFKGPRRKIRGITASGVITEVGANVTRYTVGDAVYFIQSMKAGCWAEYIVIDEKSVMAKKPDNISYIEAAPLAFGALSAYHFINQKTIQKQDKVLIYGASGSVGSYALQLAKYYGAEVTAVSSKKNHDLLLSLGADHVIDYNATDFRTTSKQYDVIFDAVMKLTKSSCKTVMKKNAKYLSVKMPTKESSSRLEELNIIIQEGKLQSVIDSTYNIEHYKEANDKTFSGHKVGNVVIDFIKE